MSTRGKTTPDSTPGSYAPHAGQRSRIEIPHPDGGASLAALISPNTVTVLDGPASDYPSADLPDGTCVRIVAATPGTPVKNGSYWACTQDCTLANGDTVNVPSGGHWAQRQKTKADAIRYSREYDHNPAGHYMQIVGGVPHPDTYHPSSVYSEVHATEGRLVVEGPEGRPDNPNLLKIKTTTVHIGAGRIDESERHVELHPNDISGIPKIG